MSIWTAVQVMTDKSNHCMLVKEGMSGKSMYSTKVWSKKKTSNRITSHREGLIETEYGLRHNYCSVIVTDKLWWVLALSRVQELEKDVKYIWFTMFLAGQDSYTYDNTSGKAGAQIPQLPLVDDSPPWGR
jgi:hypothetical protein